jgi:hypothetical protein
MTPKTKPYDKQRRNLDLRRSQVPTPLTTEEIAEWEEE